MNNLIFLSKNVKTKIRSANAVDRDSWFLLKNIKICKVVGLRNDKDEINAHLYCFQRSKPYFSKPLDSKLLNICLFSQNSHFVISTISRNDIDKKFDAIPKAEGTLLLILMMHNICL